MQILFKDDKNNDVLIPNIDNCVTISVSSYASYVLFETVDGRKISTPDFEDREAAVEFLKEIYKMRKSKNNAFRR